MLLGILTFMSVTTLAHDPGLSAAEVRVAGDRIVAEVSFAPQDLAGLQQSDANLLVLADDQGKLDLRSVTRKASDSNSVHFVLEFSANSNAAELRISTPVLANLPPGHKQFCSVYDRENRILADRMLSAGSNDFRIDLRSASAAADTSIFRFLVLGADHILTGYDHLAFLLALLLGGGSLRQNVKIITSFTVAHSVTLALATLGVINISPAIVEPVIAASIVFVGLENLFRRRIAARWLVTFVFGLVHGLGLASALRELGVGGFGARAALPLLSFNLGVEIVQIAIATVILPLVWRLEKHPTFALKHVPVLSLLIASAGTYWLIVRVF